MYSKKTGAQEIKEAPNLRVRWTGRNGLYKSEMAPSATTQLVNALSCVHCVYAIHPATAQTVSRKKL